MAKIFANPALVSAVKAASEFIAEVAGYEEGVKPPSLIWQPVKEPVGNSSMQTAWLREATRILPDLALYKEMDQMASWEAAALNRFFSERNWEIRFEERIPDKFSFYAGAAYRISFPWKKTGSTEWYKGGPILINDRPAFSLGIQNGVEILDFGLQKPIVVIEGRNSGDYLFFTFAPEELEQGALWSHVSVLHQVWLANKYRFADYDGVVLPNIEIKTTPEELPWLSGLHYRDWWIEKAKIQGELKVGPKGAVFGGAGGVEVMRGGSGPLEVDYDIYVWFWRKGCVAPGFAAYVPASEFADHEVDVPV